MKKLTTMLGVLFLLSACDKQINISITDKNEQNQIVHKQNNITLNNLSNNSIIQSSGKMISIPLSNNTSGSGNIEITHVKNIQQLIKTGLGEVTLGGKNVSDE